MFGMLLPLLFLVLAGSLIARRLRHSLREDGTSTLPGERRPFDSLVVRAAKERGGTLTLSDVVLETGLEFDQAEERMEGLVRSGRVRMDVDDDGRMTYVFPDLKGGRSLPEA